MKKLKPFLMWWIVFVTSLIGFGLASQYGLIEQLWVVDISKISFLILSIYLIFSPICGWIAWNINKFNMTKYLGIGWFIAGTFVILGLIGTLIGFIIAFSELISISGSISTAEIKDMIQVLGSGLGVAFTTTLVGFICSLLLKIQLVIIEFFKNG